MSDFNPVTLFFTFWGLNVLRRDHADLPRTARIAVRHRSPHVLLPVRDLADADRFGGENDRRGQALGEDHFHAMPA